jgi:hypothetical protein
MGKVLQVRLYAYTYAEDDVRREWPKLWKWAFEETKPGFPYEKSGVFELIRALDDMLQFEKSPDELREVLAQYLPAVTAQVRNLEEALADWDPRAANIATDRIEEALTELERNTPRAA